MGNTDRGYRDDLKRLQGDWDTFGRTLQADYQEDWQKVWTHARNFVDAGDRQNPSDPMNAVLMSICLAQQREIRHLRREIMSRLDSSE